MHAPTWTASPVVMGSKEKRRLGAQNKNKLNGKHFIKSNLHKHIYKIYSYKVYKDLLDMGCF